MKFVAMALLMACFTMGYAQCDQGNIYGQRGQKTGFAIVFADSNGQHVAPTAALSLPTFKGGNKAMCRYINKTKKYPVNLKNQKISGTTTVQAKVLKDSTLTDIEVVSSSGYEEFDNEALRVVKSFPKMIPAAQSCEPQDMIIQIPVTFIYEEEIAADKKKAEMEQAKKDVLKPITLYFENDRPDPRTKQETTNTEYMGLYNNYMAAKGNYVTSAGKGLTGAQKTNAENAVQAFFNDSIQTGHDRLVKMTNFIVEALKDGHQVEFTISGFASLQQAPLRPSYRERPQLHVAGTRRLLGSVHQRLEVRSHHPQGSGRPGQPQLLHQRSARDCLWSAGCQGQKDCHRPHHRQVNSCDTDIQKGTEMVPFFG